MFDHYGVIENAFNLDTTPGANTVVSPPKSFNGSDTEYVKFLHEVYCDPGGFQHLVIAAQNVRLKRGILSGPFAHKARAVFASIEKRLAERASQ